MKITFKRINGEYIVVAGACTIHCETNKQAWELIFELRKEVA